MKRRVRGLLRNSWLTPLGALLLAHLPIILVSLLVFFLVLPRGVDGAQAIELQLTFTDTRSFLISLLMVFSRPSAFFAPLTGWLPTIAIMFTVHLFIWLPICVSLAGYFMHFLRGKNARVLDVLNCFSGRYPRALGGMGYMLLWECVWFIVCFVLPTVLLFAGAPLVSSLGIELLQQIRIFGVIVVVCVLWILVATFVFLNRMLAYCLTPVALAAQPRLPAHRAVRLSRKLMRGSKLRLIGLFLSFMNYFLPAILSLLLLPLLARYGLQLGLSEILLRSLRIFLWVVILGNQALWLYVAPYMSACFYAYYLERKREALMDEEVSPDDFGSKPKPEDVQVPAKRA